MKEKLLICWLVLFSLTTAFSQLPCEDSYYLTGFFDYTGKMYQCPVIMYPVEYNSGLSLVGNDIYSPSNGNMIEKYGFVNAKGELVLDLIYDKAKSFSDGYAAVMQAGKWGVIDPKGNTIIDYKFDGAGEFSEGLLAVKKDGKWGYIDIKGKEMIPYNFAGASKFVNGQAVAELYSDRLFYIINKTGQIVKGGFYDARSFSEGLLAVKNKDGWFYVDATGKTAILATWDKAGDFSEGLASVCENGKWGYIDKTGRIVVEPFYDYVGNFSVGCAKIRMGTNIYLINKQGKIISNACNFIYPQKNGLVYTETKGNWMEFIRPDGSTFLLDIFAKANEELLLCKDNERYFFYNIKTGNKSVKFDFPGLDYPDPDVWQPSWIPNLFCDGFVPVMKNGKWGYMNNKGDLVIDFIFSKVNNFEHGYAIIVENGLESLIDTTGRVVAGPELDYSINNDVYMLKKGDKWYLPLSENPENGFDFISAFCDDYAWIIEDGRIVFIDKQARRINKKYVEVFEFYDGMGAVNSWQMYNCADYNYGTNGCIDKTGKIVIDFTYRDKIIFNEGLAFCEGKFIDKTGKDVFSKKFYSGNNFYEGLAAVWPEQDGKMGYIDKEGNVVIACDYDLTFNFSDGLGLVRNNNKFGYIDRSGKMVIPFIYDEARSFSGGLTWVHNDSGSAYINTKGEVIFRCDFENCGEFSDGLASFEKDSKLGFMNTTGEIIINPLYNSLSGFKDGLSVVLDEVNNYFFIDKTGKKIFGPFTMANPFNGDYASVSTTHGEYMLDRKGNMLMTAKHYNYYSLFCPLKDESFFDPNFSAKETNYEYNSYVQFNILNYGMCPVANDISEGVAAVQTWCESGCANSQLMSGFIDREGNITGSGYSKISDFSEGLAAVDSFGVKCYINKSGATIIESEDFVDISNFSGGYAAVDFAGSKHFIDHSGKKLNKEPYGDIIQGFNNGLAIVESGGARYLINSKGKMVSKAYPTIIQGSTGLIPALDNASGLFGYIDAKGKLTIQYQFDIAEPFSGGFAQVQIDNKKTFINSTGKRIANLAADAERVAINLFLFRNGDFLTLVNGDCKTLADSIIMIGNKGAGNPLLEICSIMANNKITAVENANGKWGFVDINGNMLIKCYYDEVSFFENGYARAFKDGKWTIIDEKGKALCDEMDQLILQPEYSHSYCAVKNGKYELLGIDGKSLSEWYDSLGVLVDGARAVRKGNKSAIISLTGELLTDFNFDYLSRSGKSDLFIGIKNKEILFFDSNGEPTARDYELFPETYPAFSDGYVLIQTEKGFEFLNEKGVNVFGKSFKIARNFHEGLAVAWHDEGYDFLNPKGEFVTNKNFYDIRDFNCGRAWVEEKNSGYSDPQRYCINKKGEKVSATYISTKDFSEGLAAVRNKDWKWGYIDTTGKVVIPMIYEVAESSSEGLILVGEKVKNMKFIDKTGKTVIDLKKYGIAHSFSEGLAAVGFLGKGGWEMGYIDKDAKEVFPLKYNNANDFHEGIAVVGNLSNSGSFNYAFHYIDKEGNDLFGELGEFESAQNFDHGYAVIENSYSNMVIDKSGRIIRVKSRW